MAEATLRQKAYGVCERHLREAHFKSVRLPEALDYVAMKMFIAKTALDDPDAEIIRAALLKLHEDGVL